MATCQECDGFTPQRPQSETDYSKNCGDYGRPGFGTGVAVCPCDVDLIDGYFAVGNGGYGRNWVASGSRSSVVHIRIGVPICDNDGNYAPPITPIHSYNNVAQISRGSSTWLGGYNAVGHWELVDDNTLIRHWKCVYESPYYGSPQTETRPAVIYSHKDGNGIFCVDPKRTAENAVAVLSINDRNCTRCHELQAAISGSPCAVMLTMWNCCKRRTYTAGSSIVTVVEGEKWDWNSISCSYDVTPSTCPSCPLIGDQVFGGYMARLCGGVPGSCGFTTLRTYLKQSSSVASTYTDATCPAFTGLVVDDLSPLGCDPWIWGSGPFTELDGTSCGGFSGRIYTGPSVGTSNTCDHTARPQSCPTYPSW